MRFGSRPCSHDEPAKRRGADLMRSGLAVAVCAAMLTSPGDTAVLAQSTAEIKRQREAAFKELDTDGNQRLSEQEYLKRKGDAKTLRRDFHLFDFSNDNSLSRPEFAATPGIGTSAQRGVVPDPFQGLLDQAVDAMDQAYDGWNLRPEQQMNSTFFAINFAASLATDNRRRLDREIVSQSDPNGDHMVTRDEAKRFLEIQLGLRWTTGTRLRLASGMVVNFSRFLDTDMDADDVLTKEEFEQSWWRPETAEQDFKVNDRNGDGEVTLAEFADPAGPNLFDPIHFFRQGDTNFDGQLDAEELSHSIHEHRKHLIDSSVRAFDDDKDGKLSLSEFRVTMLANYNYPWPRKPKDRNNDDLLTYEEFVFSSKRDLFQLQRRLYFHRLDRNADKKLSSDEFVFQGKPLHSLVLFEIATGQSKELYRDKEFPSCGSPAVSPDGKWIAFDAVPTEGISKTRIMLMSFEGAEVKNLCDGLMPSWSPDGDRFACSRYEGGSGVWIMKRDGTPEKRISDGWAAQWSPDGKSIAFTSDNSLRVYDLESGKTRVVLPKDAHPYQYIFWNMSWSPDSSQMVFKGRLPNKQELAIVNMTGKPELKSYHASSKSIASDLAWSPDGKRILFNMHSPEFRRNLMYQFSPGSDDPPQLVPGISQQTTWGSVGFSPDNRWLVLSTQN